ncbi:MAG: hypothetical protein QW607_12605, partial [Desulfurococcaceae archaeon]
MAIAFRYKDKDYQIPEKLINPYFSEEFVVGKDIEPVAVFSVKGYEYLTEMKLFFDYLKESKDLSVDMIYDMIEIIDGIVRNKIGWNKLLAGLRKTFDKEIFQPIIDSISKNIEDFSNNHLNVPEKSLIVNELETRFEKLVNKLKDFINSKLDEISNLLSNRDMNKVKEKVKEIDILSSSASEILQIYSDIIKESNMDKIGNIIYNDIFKINKLKNMLQGESKNIVKYFIDKFPQYKNLFEMFLENITKSIEDDIFDTKKITSIKNDKIFKYFDAFFFPEFNIPQNRKYKEELFFALLNPDNLKFFDINYINNFADFTEFVEKTNILKNDKAFSLFFYYGYKYLYEFIQNSDDFDEKVVQNDFDKIASVKMDEFLNMFPLRDEHIRNLGKEQEIYLYKLKPEKSDPEFNTNIYPSRLMQKYFGVANINSCVREEITHDINENKTEFYRLPNDAEFIIIADKNGKTLGRFSIHNSGEVEKTPMNIFMQGKAHEIAFYFGGRAIMEKYLEEIGYKQKGDINKSLMYATLTDIMENDRIAFMENKIATGFMGEMFFYINQILVPFEKFYR